MKGITISIILSVFLIGSCWATINLPDVYVNKYEFKYAHSFKPPFFVVQGNEIPFWAFGGSTVATEEFLRLTPDAKDTIGWMWNQEPNDLQEWEAILEFKVHGHAIGADGMAFWYTQESEKVGNVYGSIDKWHGLAVIFDSFDNDDRGNNPRVQVIYNDGTIAYDHANDAIHQELSGCAYNFRNSPESVIARIRYQSETITVMLGYKNEDPFTYYTCVRNLVIPKLPIGGFFGITAQTGGLVDTHDVYSLTVFDLNPEQTELHYKQQENIRKETHEEEEGDAELREQLSHSVREMIRQEEKRVLSTHPPNKPLPEKLKKIVERLKKLEKLNKPTKHKPVDFHVDSPQSNNIYNGTISKESYNYLLVLIRVLEEQQGKIAEAFDAILSELDTEKNMIQEQQHGMSVSLRGIYETVITSEDIRDLSENLNSLRHLPNKLEAIAKTVDLIKSVAISLTSFDSDSSHQTMKRKISNIHQAQSQANNHFYEQVKTSDQLLTRAISSWEKTGSSSSSSWLFYVMLVETVALAAFFVYSTFLKKKAKY